MRMIKIWIAWTSSVHAVANTEADAIIAVRNLDKSGDVHTKSEDVWLGRAGLDLSALPAQATRPKMADGR